jgi:cobalamin-dependent methionine synthase I
MSQNPVILFFLNLTLPVVVGATGTAYQWTDKQGQVHYGDTPSASDNPRAIILQQDTTGVESQGDLRPGERDQIRHMNQRQLQQQRRAQTRRIHADRQRAARRADCASNREMLKTSRGRDAFKQHARYLRNNCW